MSLASFAIGSKEVVAASIAPSTAVLIISATSTNAIDDEQDDELDLRDADRAATMITATAATKWIRMLRCVRSTWTTPSIA